MCIYIYTSHMCVCIYVYIYIYIRKGDVISVLSPCNLKDELSIMSMQCNNDEDHRKDPACDKTWRLSAASATAVSAASATAVSAASATTVSAAAPTARWCRCGEIRFGILVVWSQWNASALCTVLTIWCDFYRFLSTFRTHFGNYEPLAKRLANLARWISPAARPRLSTAGPGPAGLSARAARCLPGPGLSATRATARSATRSYVV